MMRRTVLLPLGLWVYLAVMAYLGLPHLRAGEYLFYFGVIGASLLVIVVLYFVLRRRERIRRENEESNYGTYKDERSKED